MQVSEYQRWPVYSKFFDNMGPIPHHMHQRAEDAKLVGQEGKPESYYFSPQMNNVDNNFAYTFMGLEPGTTPDQVRRCLENWDRGDNGILDLSKAYRLQRGTGWLIPPGVLHAPGSLCTYEPQWGSDVFGMFQSIVEGRYVPWSLLVKDMPEDKHQDLDFIVGQLDWDKNVDTHFKQSNYLEPIRDDNRSGDGFEDLYQNLEGKTRNHVAGFLEATESDSPDAYGFTSLAEDIADRPDAAEFRVLSPRHVQQGQDAAEDPLILGLSAGDRALVEHLPLHAPVPIILNVVRGTSSRVLQSLVGLVHLPKPLLVARFLVVGVIALGEQSKDALQRLVIRTLAELQDFVMIDELLLIHQEFPSLVSRAFCHATRQDAGPARAPGARNRYRCKGRSACRQSI